MCVERPSCFRSSCGQVEFPPDLCSRVTFVNFTVTRGSLQSQCLNQVLKAERPDVDAKRSDLLKLQGMLYIYLYHDVVRYTVLLTRKKEFALSSNM